MYNEYFNNNKIRLFILYTYLDVLLCAFYMNVILAIVKVIFV